MNEEEADKLYAEVWPDYFTRQARDIFWYERLWAVLLRQLERRTDGRTLIEFGSGPGFLLAQATRRGWSALGEEPSSLARDHAKRLGAFSAEPGFWVCRSAAGIATEVLEHVDDPLVTLNEWRDAIEPGGLLALSVPNDNNPLQRLFRRSWLHPTHKRYYSMRTLTADLEATGFEVIWKRTSFPVELLLALPIKPNLAWKLSRIWPAPPLLWRFGIGRHCLVVAKVSAASSSAPS